MQARNWKQYLHLLEFVYKSSTHTSIGYSPSTSMYDFQLRPLPMLTLIEMYIKFCQGYARNVAYCIDNIKTAQDKAHFYTDHNR